MNNFKSSFLFIALVAFLGLQPQQGTASEPMGTPARSKPHCEPLRHTSNTAVLAGCLRFISHQEPRSTQSGPRPGQRASN